MSHIFIVFEGVDGSGKSEVSKLVAKKLGAAHLESPTTPFSSIRNHIDENLCDKGRFYFYMASNFDLSKKLTKIVDSSSVICTRYFHSTIIGYASRQNLDIEKFYKTCIFTKSDFLSPNLTIFLTINEETQKKRIESRGLLKISKSDYKCLEDRKYRERLFINYKYIAEQEGWHSIDTSSMLIDDVVAQCMNIIYEHTPKEPINPPQN